MIHVGGVYFFARLWKRTNVLTDMEYVYFRYSGRSADILRGFKALYLAIPYGCIVMGWVNKAMAKIISLSIPIFPRFPGIDWLLERIYLNTPISGALNESVKAAIKQGTIDPYALYSQAQTMGADIGPEELIRLNSYVAKGVEQSKIMEQFNLGQFVDSMGSATGAVSNFDPITLIHSVELSCRVFMS
jgi:hypothetical protein